MRGGRGKNQEDFQACCTPPDTLTRCSCCCAKTQFVREQIAAPLGLEDSFYLGGLSARGVKPSRIAHVEHTFKAFKVPGRPANVPGHEEEKESMPAPAPAPGQSTQQASGSSSGGRGRESSRASSALVGREPSAESKQSVAGEDDVIGIEDVDEVRQDRSGEKRHRCETPSLRESKSSR